MASSVTSKYVSNQVIEELSCDVNFLEKFAITKLIPDDFKRQISNFHVFYGTLGCNILFITKSDQVYGLGSNRGGCLGLGHCDAVDKPQLVRELCDKKVLRFHIGTHHVFVRCENHIYAWKTYTGVGFLDENYDDNSMPLAREVQCLSGKHFKSMTSGVHFTLGVSNEGELYIFDKDVENPRIITGDRFYKPIRKALQMNLLHFIIFGDGRVLAWGNNAWKNLGVRSKEMYVEQPVFLELGDVRDIRSTVINTYFLTKNGHIYFCGVYYQHEDGIAKVCYQCEPKELDQNRKFQSMILFDDKQHILARSNGKIFELIHDKLYETTYSNYKDYLADNFQLTVSTFTVNDPNNSNDEQLPTMAITHHNADRFETQFSSKIVLGTGAFGVAYKVRDKFDGKYYCIKKIDRRNVVDHFRSADVVIREMFALHASMVHSTVMLKFYGMWNCGNFTFFKIELMDSNLSDLVKLSRKIFNRKKFGTMDSVEFQLNCHLFIDILLCVHELHMNNIMHRDLKLENILVNFIPADCHNHIKLGDLGSSRFHQSVEESTNEQEKGDDVQVGFSLTQGIGTPGYIAPEVKRGTEYSFSADIWSLGVIAKDMFGIRNRETFLLYEKNSNLCEEFRTISETIQSMTDEDPLKRCAIPAIVNKFRSVIEETDIDLKKKLLIEFGEISRRKDDVDFDDSLNLCRIRLHSLTR